MVWLHYNNNKMSLSKCVVEHGWLVLLARTSLSTQFEVQVKQSQGLVHYPISSRTVINNKSQMKSTPAPTDTQTQTETQTTTRM